MTTGKRQRNLKVVVVATFILACFGITAALAAANVSADATISSTSGRPASSSNIALTINPPTATALHKQTLPIALHH